MNARHGTLDEALLRRVHGEFLEMPGLWLTGQQAQRLWGLDEGTCLELLELLVDARFLYRSGRGIYTRLTDGRDAGPYIRMAKPSIEDPSPAKNEAGRR